MPVKRALISVSDKSGLKELAGFLIGNGVFVIGTGGVKAALSPSLNIQEVADLTGMPEMLDGRVKTLHPGIHGGILADRDIASHNEDLKKHDILPIDLVVVNLYPFFSKPSVDNIDIGGPAMIRAAAKNFRHVCVITDVNDYPLLIDELKKNKMNISDEFRKSMAQKAFALTSWYDGLIASDALFETGEKGAMLPEILCNPCREALKLRYGENSNQRAAFFTRNGQLGFKQMQGKELSYNNLSDADTAFRTVSDFREPTVAIIKHNTPCGVSSAGNAVDAYRRALDADSVSAFGGIVGINAPVTKELAALIVNIFTEVVIAPCFDSEALDILRQKANLRVIELRSAWPAFEVRSALGGVLAQTPNDYIVREEDIKVVTETQFDVAKYKDDILFAYKVCKHVTSNAIVIARDRTAIGIGCGQTNRIDSARIAMRNCDCTGAVLASDGFFPFPDIVREAAQNNIGCIVQPGGSMRDDSVIAEANRLKVPMVFVGTRCFKH